MSVMLEQLLAEARLMCSDTRLRRIVGRHAGLEQAALLDCTVHQNDQMLLHSLRHHLDANASFSQYFNVGLQQFRAFMQVWQRLGFDRQQPPAQVLDFACGYGRLLRFLVPALSVDTVYGAEIQADALNFVAQHFGVNTWPSAYEPNEFDPGKQFDLIWVASLFSHLPGQLFTAWLARLKELLSERGVLCFSVHDQCLLPAGEQMPQEGMRFYTASENQELDNQAYGTTYVTEAYVAEKIKQLFGASYGYQRIPRGLAHEQDLYVVAPLQVYDLRPLADFTYGPWGWVDERSYKDGQLYLRGWAASLDSGVLESVDIFVDGVRHTCVTGLLRDDVAQVFSRPQLALSGWEFSLSLPSGADKVLVEVSAQDATGQPALLYTGFIALLK